MKTIAVYGSLKKGKYNHDMIAQGKFLGNVKLKGTMYKVSSYPALVESGDLEYDAELYMVTPNDYQSVDNMELGAGYERRVAEFEVDGSTVTATYYVAGNSLRSYCEKNKTIIQKY